MTLASRIDAAIAAARQEDGLLRITDTCTQQTLRKVLVRRPDLQAQVVKRPRGTKQVCLLIAELPLRRLLSHMPLNQIMVRGESTTAPAAALLPSDPPSETQANAPTEPSLAPADAPEDAHETIAPERAPTITALGDSSDAPQTLATPCSQQAPSPSVTARQFSGGGMNFIVERRSDGYLNATAMCKAYGKLFAHYASTDSAAAYLDALAKDIIENSSMGNPILENSSIGITILDFHATRESLVQSKHGGPHRGTWVHDLVAVHLAQWLSPEFAVWVSSWMLRTAILPAQSSQSSSVVVQARSNASSSSTDIQRSSIPRFPCRLEIRPKPEGIQAAACKMHCYTSLVQGTDTVDEQGRLLIKIGCGDDPMLRSEAAHGEVKKYQKDWHFSLFRIFQEVGQAMETLMHRKFKTPPYGKKYEHPGFREYFWVDPDVYVQLVDQAFEQCIPELMQQQFQAKKDAEATLQAAPSRTHDLQFRREEAELEADIADRAADVADRALLRKRSELEIQRAELELEDDMEERRLKRRKLAAEVRLAEAKVDIEIRSMMACASDDSLSLAATMARLENNQLSFSTQQPKK
jgi:hypothetical protein